MFDVEVEVDVEMAILQFGLPGQDRTAQDSTSTPLCSIFIASHPCPVPVSIDLLVSFLSLFSTILLLLLSELQSDKLNMRCYIFS